jgi:hypothetical protein
MAIPFFTMVELLREFPAYVMAYRASGKVNREEYERIVMPRADEVAHQFGSINFLVKLETDIQNYSLATLVDYLKISFKHIHRWNRMAIVSDQKSVRAFFDALSPLVPGKIIGFPLKDFEKAKAWVSEPFLTDENALRWNWKTGMAAGLLGTSAMTLLSHFISKLGRKEPNIPAVLGWQAHYAFGTIWGLTYAFWKNGKHPLSRALLFGAMGGAAGVFLWKKAFDLNPRPPRIDYPKFYAEVFLAHLIFGLTVQQVYALGSKPSAVNH